MATKEIYVLPILNTPAVLFLAMFKVPILKYLKYLSPYIKIFKIFKYSSSPLFGNVQSHNIEAAPEKVAALGR